MNYKKIYDQLVEKCKVRGLDKSALGGYYEKHHIIPRCMGGSDDVENFVLFTAREHVFAHLCLWKSYPKHVGVVTAAQMMADTRKHGKLLSSRLLASLRVQSSISRSMRKEGAGYGETRHIDLEGQKFGRLTVTGSYSWYYFPNGQRKAKWECLCDCGNAANVMVGALQSGYTQSCGCLQKERASAARKKWDFSRKTYEAYHNMLARCYSPAHKSNDNFVKYGVEVCDEWLGEDGILTFVEDMGEKPDSLQLIRLNPFANFCKDNCKWVTKQESSKSIYKFPRKVKPISARTGVKYDKRRNKYVARIVLNGKEQTKQFSLLEDAILQRESWEEEYRIHTET